MRSLSLGLLILPMLIVSGCSMMNDFGEFSFGQKQGDLGDAGGAGGGGGRDGSADNGGDNGGNAGNGGNNGSGLDGGATAGEDAGPPVDPICAAAACDPVATCNSSTGVAVCSCPMGYFDMKNDGTECRDLNECKAGIDACDEHSVCENTPGSYKCNCDLGFIFNKADNTCIDDCVVLLSTTCDDEALCLKPAGFGICSCPFGFKDVSALKDGSQCEVDSTCAGLTCDELALCDTSGGAPACKCPAGYTGNGATCTDVNECAANNGGCDAKSACENTAGGRVCRCKSGFTGDDTGNGSTCTDVDECAAEDDNCAANAKCTNTPGAFTCACNSGYTGDGVACVDKDECTLGGTANNCAAGTSICTNTPGAFSCQCKGGYSGDGTSCTDVNECSTNNGNCGTGVLCSNSAGSFECGCGPGLRKNASGVCVDINECTENLSNCNTNANCTNTTGSFTCACKSGYTGNGVTCDDVNECLTSNGLCSANANCTNTGGGRTCACKSGFTGDGVTCTDINECTTNNGGCSTNGTCTNTAGSRTCACKSGYSGDGVSCTDNNECSLGTSNCSANGNCTNTAGSFTCACKSGFTGNGVTCTDINECTGTATDPCDDLPTAACANTSGSYTCTCPSGYAGGTGIGQTGCCTPDGSTDTALPNDAKDNECDGFIDRPVINTSVTFPESGGAAGGSHVSIAINSSVIPSAALQCRSYKRSGAVPAFAACANPILPFTAAASADAANNGAWRTDVRWVYTGGALSNTTSYDYYIHNSLHAVSRCSLGVTDDALFSAADAVLNASLVGPGYADQGAFKIGTETFLANPFVTVGYQPIAGDSFTLRRSLSQSGNVSIGYRADMWSLRHRFVVGGANNRYVLIRRAYASRTALRFNASDIRCTAAKFKILDSSFIKNVAGGWGSSVTGHSCDAVVVNRAGAGVCFSVSKGVITRVNPQNLPGSSGYGYGTSNKFYWRLLLDEQGWHGKWVGTRPAPESGFRNFSEKCDTANCNSDNAVELFLPDKSILRP